MIKKTLLFLTLAGAGLISLAPGPVITNGGSGGGSTPPTGTGFTRNTAGVQDAASVAETGTGSVVRATSPALTTPTGIVKGDVGLGSVENTALSTWAGSANVTTLGTIGSGTWNGTTVSTITLAPAVNAVADGLTLTDTTAASSGNQQYSPAIHLTGQGWKTTATAASQSVDFRQYVVPVQGTTNPTGNWKLESSVNGGAYGNSLNYTSAGQLISPIGTSALPSFSFAGDTSTGIYQDASGHISFSSGGGFGVEIEGAIGGIRIHPSWKFGWGSANPSSVYDTGLSRNAAGVVEVNNGTAGTFRDLKIRQHFVDQTVTAGGTTGAQTINKAAGTVNFAAAATSLVVTDSLVTANSTIYCSIRTNDSTALLKNVVPAAGSFTINLNAAATAETSVGFIVIN